jgi:hypothetical protein
MTSAITGSSTVVIDISAIANITADITPFTELSPEGLAASVWNAVADAYNTSGTMGQKLNLASSGGVDYAALAAAVWESLATDYSQEETMGLFMNDLRKMLMSKAIKTGNIVTIYEDDGQTIWKRFDLTNSGRTEI